MCHQTKVPASSPLNYDGWVIANYAPCIWMERNSETFGNIYVQSLLNAFLVVVNYYLTWKD